MTDIRSYSYFCRFSKINDTKEDGIVEYDFNEIYLKLCNKYPNAKIMYIVHDKDITNIHAHFIIQNETQIRKSTLIKLVKYGSIEKQKGSNLECYNYLMHKNIEDKEPYDSNQIICNFQEVLEEWLKKGNAKLSEYDNMLIALYGGASLQEIRNNYPRAYMRNHNNIKSIRLELLSEKANKYREVLVIYIYGKSRTNKTRSVIEYCMENDFSYYRVTDYDKDPFQNYEDQKVLILDEYRSNFTVSNFLTYLEGYSKTYLPSRYNNKYALYDIAFVISNIPLSNQYPYIDEETKNAINNRFMYTAHFNKESVEIFQSDKIIKCIVNPYYKKNKQEGGVNDNN